MALSLFQEVELDWPSLNVSENCFGFLVSIRLCGWVDAYNDLKCASRTMSPAQSEGILNNVHSRTLLSAPH